MTQTLVNLSRDIYTTTVVNGNFY